MAVLNVVRTVGGLSRPSGTEMFRQGDLSVWAREGGWSIVLSQRAVADVDVHGNTNLCLVDADLDTVQVADSVVLVVALAIIERVQGWFHVHAGLVVDDAVGVTLVVGESGAGKTTTTLSLAARGRLGCDDVVFVQPGADGICARAFVRPLHVGAATLAMFPALQERLENGRSQAGKLIVRVDEGEAESDVALRVSLLVFPAIDNRATTVAESLTSSEVLPRLLRASAMVAWPCLPHAAEHLDSLVKLSRLPARALHLGLDALVDPACIARALHSVRA